MNDLRLSIHQTFAQIGIQTRWASLDIHNYPGGDLEIQQPQAQVQMHSPPGDMQIDSSAAWAALSKGSVLQLNSSIYSQCKEVALQAIAQMVQDGNRMAQITNPRNAFAEIAGDVFQRESSIDYVAPAAYDNVKIQYDPRKPEINIEPQHAIIQYAPKKPDVQYNPGKVDIYMKQKQSIEITVSQYDWYK